MTSIEEVQIQSSTDPTPLARPNNAFSQKIASILSSSYTDPSIRRAISSLDSRLRENTSYSRRHLRYNTEAEIITFNGAALKDYSKLVNKLESLGSTISQLTSTFNEMLAESKNANNTTKALLQEAHSLKEQEDNVKVKKVLLASFKAKFVVSDDEIQILTSSSYPINDNFFAALQRVNKTHLDCQALLSTDDQQMGLDIMQAMSNYLDKAYDRLFFTVQRDLKVAISSSSIGFGRPLSTKDEATFKKTLSRSLAILTERPNLFESALKSLAESRNRALSAKFVDALTVDTRIEKAIDFYAYDPLRYVGDMLAYVHSEIVNERENLSTLFEYNFHYRQNQNLSQSKELEELDRTAPWSEFDTPNETIPKLLDKVTSSMIKPLKARIENIIALETRIPLIYQLIDKFKFYESMYNKAFFGDSLLNRYSEKGPKNHESKKDYEKNYTGVSSESGLNVVPEIIKVLDQLADYGWRQFSKCLEEKIFDIKDNMLSTTSELQPPDFLVDAISDVKEVLKSYETSMVVSLVSPALEEGKKDLHSIQQVIQDMTEPFLECCNRIASDLPDNDSELFTINCIDAVKLVLQMYDTIAATKIKHLDSLLDEISEVLIERQHRLFLNTSGMLPIMSKVHEYYSLVSRKNESEKNDSERTTKLADLKREMELGPLSKDKLAELSFSLDNFLPSATMESHSFLFRLASPRLAQSITLRASYLFASDFSELERLVLDIYNIEESRIYFPRTYMDVCVLLAIVDDNTSMKSIR